VFIGKWYDSEVDYSEVIFGARIWHLKIMDVYITPDSIGKLTVYGVEG